MPVPRKSILALNKTKTTRKRTAKKKTLTSRTKKGEKLLVICAPVMPHYLVEEVAESLHGAFFTDTDGAIFKWLPCASMGRRSMGSARRCMRQDTAPYDI